MKIIYNDSPLFYISLEDVFSEEEWNNVYQELNSLKPKFKSPEHTGSAFISSKILKKNKGVFLSGEIEGKQSKIIPYIDYKLKKIKNDKWNIKVLKRIFDSLMWGSELINYYENDDYYKPHVDNGIFTLIIWVWDKNLDYEGGDLYFPEYNHLHKCKNNHGILFLSKEIHGATTFKTNTKNNGRYSIVSFSQINEENDDHFRKAFSLKYQ